jgi:hypothetical protein
MRVPGNFITRRCKNAIKCRKCHLTKNTAYIAATSVAYKHKVMLQSYRRISEENNVAVLRTNRKL